MLTCRHLAVPAMLAAACTACTTPAQAGHEPARRHVVSHQRPAPASCSAIPLPLGPAGLRAAAALAARFAAAYQTRPPGQTPGRWLARLRPMATTMLAGALARTAATPALWPPGQAVAARAVTERVRGLAPGSVIFTVQIRQTITTSTGTTTSADVLAVTVVSNSRGWAVWDVEPADAGNPG